MVVSVPAATVIGALRSRKALSVRQAGFNLALSALVATLLLYLTGAFIIPPQYCDGGVSFGKYSFNLLGFFNPMGYSVLFPDMPVFPDQYEGFAYLGLGIMVLCGFALAGVFRARKQRSDDDWWSI